MFRWGASPHDVASMGGAAPIFASGGEFWQCLAPALPPLGEFLVSSETEIITPELSFGSGRRSALLLGGGRRSALLLGGGRRSALLLAGGRCLALLLGGGRRSAPPLSCGRRVGPFGLAVKSCAPPTCLAPASRSPHVPCLDPRSPHLPRLGPHFPPLALLLLLAPPPSDSPCFSLPPPTSLCSLLLLRTHRWPGLSGRAKTLSGKGCVSVGLCLRTKEHLKPTVTAWLFTNFIPDRSRPGLTTTAIGAVDLQGAGGNWATVGRRSRGGRRVRRQREKRKGKSVGLRIGTLNVGTMTGKGRELADVMERRKVDILCVQETRWKGSKARSIGAGFKLFYYGVDSKRNGVGVVLKEEFVRNVLEVKRVSDRVMSLKLEIEGVMLNVVSGYAPQVGCELEEKERFWSELDEVMESIPMGERVVIGADFNGHVGEGNTGDEEVMGKFGVKERNLEGQMVVDFAKRMDMAVVNTYFQKREEHRVTYKSGGRRTQKKRSKIEKKTKWWKLKKEECCEEFRQKLRQALGGQVVLPDDWETTAEVIRETGRKVLGVSSGRRKEDKETWWWNEEVQDSIQRKRLAKKKWDMDRTEENRQEYKELQRRVKREVSKAKQKAYEELYTRLDTREGEKDLYRLARQRDRDGKNVQQKVDKIRKDEVRKALKRMKSGKAVGPDDIPVEVWKCLGEAAVEFLANLFNRVLENLEKAYDRVPREELWYCMRKSGVAEKYVRVVQDMYERSRTVVRCAVGQTEEFNVEVGLHQGSALSPFLFAMVMDQLSEEVRQESPWTMMFADDIVICSESREQVEENLERWRFALERRGMKVSRIQSNGECGKEKISARIKGKVYRTVVRPAMLYGLETVSLRKRQESELERRESEHIGRRVLDVGLPGRRQRGRPKRRHISYDPHSHYNDNASLLKRSYWVAWKPLISRLLATKFGSLGYTIMGKTADLTVVQETIIDTLHKEEEKERFWSELDEVMESIPTGERVVIGADFNGHVGEGNTGDEEVMGKFGVKERNLEGQMVVDFAKRMDMAVVKTYFQKREEHRVTYKSGGRRTQVDYILCRRGNLKEISDCKVVVGESVARQHRMVVCRMTLMVCKMKRSKIEIEKKTKWWKLKKEECCEEFTQKLRQALGGQVVLPDNWKTTAEVIRETGRKVLGVSPGRRKEDKETWWWNEEVQDSIQRKRLAKKKWDMDRTEENRQKYKELQRRVKREVSKAKQKAYDEFYTRLDTREGEKDLYRLARKRDRDGKDVQQVRVIKDRDGRVLTSEESVQRRWKEYFEELMNEENEREKRVEGVNSVEQKVDKIREVRKVRKALKRMKSGKAVGPDDIPEV
ncbi:hypothetical protein QTP70_010825 [Hemibagrus guttatus]|uniref:ribonuclease H n=1 Tax=Hemibagrus guttatus TaxID=175788 RepID=A0AAE0RJZ6_9TELE|nr:hypothetical protein QTP70_010825 [Hemibagrus guttatus]